VINILRLCRPKQQSPQSVSGRKIDCVTFSVFRKNHTYVSDYNSGLAFLGRNKIKEGVFPIRSKVVQCTFLTVRSKFL